MQRHGRHDPRPPVSVFLATTMVFFVLSLSAADSIGLVPYYIDGTPPAGGADSVALSALPQLGEGETSLPARIEIPEVDLDLPVQNPGTRDVGTLDALLQGGPARYVDSARLGQEGNVIIFAHSSHLPIVHNKMFQAFNRIPDLNAGDTITLVAEDGTHYLYSVDGVAKADVHDGTEIPLVGAGSKLTLVTCDTLTGKSARFILTATLVGTE